MLTETKNKKQHIIIKAEMYGIVAAHFGVVQGEAVVVFGK